MANANPLPVNPYPPGKPPQPSSNSTTIVVFILAILGGVLLLVIGCVVAIVFAMSAALAPAVSSARDAARNAESMNNLKRIGVAIHNYHDTYRQLPPAYLTVNEREPALSWRVSILPHLEQAALFDRIDKSKRWNELPNGQYNSQAIEDYHSPLDPATATDTSYVGIVGPSAAFSADSVQTIAKIRDGTSNTICVIELQNSEINWMEPRDLTIDEAVAAIKNSPNKKVNVLMLDGSVKPLDHGLISPGELRGMMTIDGGEQPPSGF